MDLVNSNRQRLPTSRSLPETAKAACGIRFCHAAFFMDLHNKIGNTQWKWSCKLCVLRFFFQWTEPRGGLVFLVSSAITQVTHSTSFHRVSAMNRLAKFFSRATSKNTAPRLSHTLASPEWQRLTDFDVAGFARIREFLSPPAGWRCQLPRRGHFSSDGTIAQTLKVRCLRFAVGESRAKPRPRIQQEILQRSTAQ